MFPYWLYGGPIHPVYGLLLPAIAFLFALYAQWRVKSAFGRFSQVTTRSGLSGREVAELLLRSRGISDVTVEATGGFLSDHYDPRSKTLRLSEEVYASRSVSALGVAAHETGHALQHADGYAWLNFRSNMVPVVTFMSKIGSVLLPIGTIITFLAVSSGTSSPVGLGMLYIAAIGLAAVVVFSLVTLPVEIDASQRAMRLLEGAGVLVGDEVEGARTVLTAAAWTYVASAAAAIVELLRILSLIRILSGRDRDSR